MNNLGFAQQKAYNLKAEMDRGRGGGAVFSHPIELEPPFKKFTYYIEQPRQGFWGMFSKTLPKKELAPKKISAPDNLGFIGIRPPVEEKLNISQFEQFILSLKLDYPLGFEIIGNQQKIVFQLVADKKDLSLIINIIQTHYPNVETTEQPDFLKKNLGDTQPVMVAYCLKESHFFPLTIDLKSDPYTVLLSNLNSINNAVAALQLLWQPIKQNWQENMLLACRDELEPAKSVFDDLPELPKLVSNKVNRQLLAVSIRLIASSKKLLTQLESFLAQYGNEYNGFIRLDKDYPVSSALKRTNHASGIILNSSELAGLIHLPDSDISVAKLAKARKTAPAPQLAQAPAGISIGQNIYQGKINPVTLNQDWLTRHMAVFGGTGAGKTNLLGYLFSQLISAGGCCFIDPNGDASEEFLSLIPQAYIDRVIYFDPINYPLSINPLEIKNHQQIEITTVNLLVAIKRLFDASAWGARMEWILRKAINTLLLAGNKTLLDIPLLLTDKNYRNNLLRSITDPDLLNFWQNIFSKFSLHALIPILDKLGIFLDSTIIKPIISQPKSDIDFNDIINNQKIFIANLSKGILGEKNAHILGSFILSQFQMAIMARAGIPKPQRKFFSLIIDEFHSYADSSNVSSINSLLSEARKYNVSLLTATQFVSQVDSRIKDAIFGNVGTLISLRVGMNDAQMLQKEFGRFAADDLLNLKVGEAIVRAGTAQDSFNLQIPLLKKPATDCKQEILNLAKKRKTPAAASATAPAPATTPSAPATTIQPTIPPIKPSLYTAQSNINLAKDENDLLEFLYKKNEPLPFTGLAKALNISTRQLYKLAGTLSNKNLIAETQINLALKTRKSRVIILTADGITALGYSTPAGKLKRIVDQNFQSPEKDKINISLLQHLFQLSFRVK